MRILLKSLYGALLAGAFSALAAIPATAQTVPPTPLELQQQADQYLQNQTLALKQHMLELQGQQAADEAQRQQLFAASPVFAQPTFPPPPPIVPPPPVIPPPHA